MKPCSKNRKLIAWLALDSLDARKEVALRDHLSRCEGCRGYWEEISRVTDGLAIVAPDSNLEASEHFHRQVAAKLRASESGTVLEKLMASLRGSMLNWRVGLTTSAVLMVALLALLATRHHPTLPPSPQSVTQAVPASTTENDLAPTLANYQMVANQSLERLSELLTRQGNKSLPPVTVYTVSGLESAKPPF